MFYTPNVEKAIRFAIKVHQLDQNQTRKGSKIPYIIHPLSVAMVVARAGGNEEAIISAILHDTIEDASLDYPVTKQDIAKEFNDNIAEMVDDLTEPTGTGSWAERKRQATEKVLKGSHDSQLIKSADILLNISDLIEEYKTIGDEMFKTSFTHASKMDYLDGYKNRIEALANSWPENPLIPELQERVKVLEAVWTVA